MGTIAVLAEVVGRNVGRTYRLELPVVVLGRSARADIQIEQAGVSRAHAEVALYDGHYFVKDRSSKNGTYVNDVLVATSPLREGDLLKVGHTILRFGFASAGDGGGPGGVLPGGGSSAPPAASSAPAAWLPVTPIPRN
jgi:pSer/pThr/pTyr-binding forkhead associated (FHA) protein